MAGLDGIKNKLDPGEAVDKDLYDLPPKELAKIPTVCGSLRQALEELNKDRAFLKAGGVFDDDFIDSYIDLKMTEVIRFQHTPHPVEFEMYYSACRFLPRSSSTISPERALARRPFFIAADGRDQNSSARTTRNAASPTSEVAPSTICI